MTDPAPLYEKVKRHITDAIVAGQYSPGAKLPSESELVEALAVSRMTVNRALRELTRDGVIFRMQGIGSFVSETGPITSLAEVRDIRDFIADRGGDYSCRTISAKSVRLDQSGMELFESEAIRSVFNLVLLHAENDRPLQLERRFVREDFAPDLLKQDFSETSLFAYLQAIAPVSELEHLVEATVPDNDERSFLALRETQPVLRIRRRTWVGSNVVTLGYFSHPGDRYSVAVRVRPSDLK